MNKKKRGISRYFTPVVGGIYFLKDTMDMITEDKKEWGQKKKRNQK